MSEILLQVALVTGIAVAGVIALRGGQRAIHKVLWRTCLFGRPGGRRLSVVFPDMLTWMARKVGVGRGADLLLYVAVVTFMLVAVALFRRVLILERRYTALARHVALLEARKPSADALEQMHRTPRDEWP